jgi:hypothetical protein
MINRVGKMCVAAMSLCMIVLIVTRKRGDGRYYFAFGFCLVRKNVLEYIIALVVVKNKVRLKKCLKKLCRCHESMYDCFDCH